ncbi:DUF6193 family natural product biosynthesis protein [Aquimarina sp. AU474]|uniref:DUF6193 family natural product biosynthesis protein n=1 Tax=Aquimarina sp. AU474 TaxID=2108529 RepID=UPI000D69A3C2|nr:DUF6193 family natural product biosynthesis protein [Aquimarina sp. AU474]
MYLEIEKHGSINEALNKEFASIGSPLRVEVDENLLKPPMSWAIIKNENKYSQVHLAKEEELYLPDFWRNGVCLANGQTNNFKELVRVVNHWLLEDVFTSELALKYELVSVDEKAEAFDEKREVKYTWNRYLRDESEDELRDFIRIAMNDQIVGKLFPYKSLTKLCLSRCTGYPYTSDTPFVNPSRVKKGVFEVWSNEYKKIGEGNALEALKYIKDCLPANIQPAISGTGNDLKK